MQITGGRAKGIRLDVPLGKRTRPTTDRVRESLFASLSAFLPEARVADLYAGTGALGLEAASRGAASVTFVESHPPAAAVLKRNAERLAPAGVEAEFRFVTHTAEGFLRTPVDSFDLALIDPPYAWFDREKEVEKLWSLLGTPWLFSEEALVVVEHPRRISPGCGEEWRILKQKDYGGTAVSFVERRWVDEDRQG